MNLNRLTAILAASFLFFGQSTWAEPDQLNHPWNGKTAAISLTYDDALNVHLDNAVPALEKHGFLGTFYIPGSFAPLGARLNEWRTIAGHGHELGNHTLFHPCDGKLPGREWVAANKDLSSWSLARYLENIQVNNTLLQSLDNQQTRTFAYPCGDMKVGEDSYVEEIKKSFVGARSVSGSSQTLGDTDLMNIHAHMVMGDSAEKMIALVDDALARKTWQVFLFHGVGGEHDLNVNEAEHNKLLAYLAKHQQELWIAPTVTIAEYVGKQQSSKSEN